jgi:hypothetical protein
MIALECISLLMEVVPSYMIDPGALKLLWSSLWLQVGCVAVASYTTVHFWGRAAWQVPEKYTPS